jgi:hypothetical protein
MTNKLKWRLTKLPTPEELTLLVEKQILSKEDAKEILLSSETEEDRDKDSLKSEVKFLRDLVEKLSQSKTQIIETIRTIEKPYRQYEWYTPYFNYCGAGDSITVGVGGNGSYAHTNASSIQLDSTDFTKINTF